MSNSSSFDIIKSYMPSKLQIVFERISLSDRQCLSEIRLRSGRPICFVYPDSMRYLRTDGRTIFTATDKNLTYAAREDIENIVLSLCRYSVHSNSRELREGFFTIENGIRVGASGSRTTADASLKYINSLNFRISREIIGCGSEIYNTLLEREPLSLIICGAPNSGKTTLLRDICRTTGDKYKAVLIDERNEISSIFRGEPMMNVGLNTDILAGYDRASGIISALRTLSPQIIFCDEICTDSDSEAIFSCSGCGVNVIATIHAENFDDLHRRRVMLPLLENNVFDYAVFMQGCGFPGKIREIRRLK